MITVSSAVHYEITRLRAELTLCLDEMKEHPGDIDYANDVMLKYINGFDVQGRISKLKKDWSELTTQDAPTMLALNEINGKIKELELLLHECFCIVVPDLNSDCKLARCLDNENILQTEDTSVQTVASLIRKVAEEVSPIAQQEAASDQIETAATSSQKETPEELVVRMRTQGVQPKEIAKVIDENFPDRFSDAGLGRLLPASPGANVTYSAERKQGQRLRGKAK